MVDSEHVSGTSCWTTCTNFTRSQKGSLLLAEIIFCLMSLFFFRDARIGYYSLSGVEMNLAIFFFVLYLCGLHTKIQCVNWPWCDFFRAFASAITYLITSIYVLAEKRNRYDITEGVLGLTGTFIFGCDAYVTFPLRQ